MSARWIVTEGRDSWSLLPDELKNIALVQPMNKRGFYLKENPTQVGSNFKKPVYEVETVNGVIVFLAPCSLPGQPLPTNPKMTMRIEHLYKEDRQKLFDLYQYDVDFFLQTNNYNVTPGEGEKYHLKILDFTDEQVALRHGRQVYTINLTVRVLK